MTEIPIKAATVATAITAFDENGLDKLSATVEPVGEITGDDVGALTNNS